MCQCVRPLTDKFNEGKCTNTMALPYVNSVGSGRSMNIFNITKTSLPFSYTLYALASSVKVCRLLIQQLGPTYLYTND